MFVSKIHKYTFFVHQQILSHFSISERMNVIWVERKDYHRKGNFVIEGIQPKYRVHNVEYYNSKYYTVRFNLGEMGE